MIMGYLEIHYEPECIGVVLMCIAQVSKMADEEMEEIKKERIDKE